MHEKEDIDEKVGKLDDTMEIFRCYVPGSGESI